MEIYADVVFVINFIMDFLIFWTVSKTLKKRVSVVRLIIGSFAMALLYCMLIFMLEFRVYLNIFAAIVIIMVGVVITFRPQDPKEFFKLIIFSHIAAFSIGGMGMALFYYTNITDILGNMLGATVNNFSFKILLVTSCSFYLLVKLWMGWLKRVLVKRQSFYPVKIYYSNSNVMLTALLDTGNSLHDPLTDAPVIVAEFNSVKEFLPEGIKINFYENIEFDFLKVAEAPENPFLGRVRMIPFESLGKKHGMLFGFRPDKVEIINDQNTIELSNVIVAIYNFKLSKDNAYQGLLNPELINQSGGK